eukprot:scaffold61845_cov22-Tisochrysis_lutea.AAC.1
MSWMRCTRLEGVGWSTVDGTWSGGWGGGRGAEGTAGMWHDLLGWQSGAQQLGAAWFAAGPSTCRKHVCIVLENSGGQSPNEAFAANTAAIRLGVGGRYRADLRQVVAELTCGSKLRTFAVSALFSFF